MGSEHGSCPRVAVMYTARLREWSYDAKDEARVLHATDVKSKGIIFGCDTLIANAIRTRDASYIALQSASMHDDVDI